MRVSILGNDDENGEVYMFRIFIQKSQEYGLDNLNLFIGSRATTTAEYSTKQDVSFNLSERKDYQLYEYAVKWISSGKKVANQVEDDDIYIVWPIKDSKCKALTLSSSGFRRTYKKSGLQTIHKKSNTAEYEVWLFRKKDIDEFFQKIMLNNNSISSLIEIEEIEHPFETKYNEGGKSYVLDSYYERNIKLREAAIDKFKTEHDGKLFCSICEFDFSKKYGIYGTGFIEVHHIIPLSEDERDKHQATVNELICVCSNCHRMLHHERPAKKPEELKRLLLQND